MKRENSLTISFDITKVLYASLILVVFYIVLVSVIPDFTIWASHKAFNNKTTHDELLVDGDSYMSEFSMPFDKVCKIEPDIISNGSDNVAQIDGELSLLTQSGDLVLNKKITSVYDCAIDTRYENVQAGEQYILRLMINRIYTDPGSPAPALRVSADTGDMSFMLSGRNDGASLKSFFGMLYLIMSVLIILYLTYMNKDNKTARRCEWLIWGVTVCICIFCLSQYYDHFMIIKSALRMRDSFKAGNIRAYYDYSYMEELSNRSSKQLFAYEYNFLSIFPIMVMLLPLSSVLSGDMLYGSESDIAVIYITFITAVFLILSAKMIDKIIKSCECEEGYSNHVRRLFLFSPMVLYMTVLYGQIDIFYIFVILAALPFYYKKRYYLFSLIMSIAVSMKLLPLIIYIPLILLANKKTRELFINFALVMSSTVLTKLVFESNSGHAAIANIIEEDYSYIERMVSVKIGDTIALFVIAFAILCIWAYFTDPDTDNKKEMLHRSMLLIFYSYVAFILFAEWHIQWMLPLAISLCFLLPLYKKPTKLWMLYMAIQFLYIITASSVTTSVYQVNYGVFTDLTDYYYSGASVNMIMSNISSISQVVVFSLLCAALLAFAFVLYRSDNKEAKEQITVFALPDKMVIGQIWIIYFFIIFYFWCYWYIG